MTENEGKKKFTCKNPSCGAETESILNLVNCPVCKCRFKELTPKQPDFMEPYAAVRRQNDILREAVQEIMFSSGPASHLRKLASNAWDNAKRFNRYYEPQGMTLDENRRSGAV